eukprot:Platyproteum_vivax@DN5375_c0_g1_i2.p1
MVVHLLVLVFCIMSMGSESKSIIGLSNFKEYDSVGSYCFTIPPGEFGKIHAQTVLHTPNHEFLVLSDTELTSAQFSCNLLHSRSKYVKPLVEHDKQVTAYDLLLNIEPNLNRQKLLAVISRCGGLVDAEYVVEFTNPGGIFKKHFSCLDLSPFAQLHSLISVFHLACRAIAGYLCYLLAWNSLQAENDVSKRQLYISIASVGAGWLAYLPIVAWLLGYQSPQLVCVLILLPHLACLFFLNMYLSPEKFGTLFDQLPATTKYHPYGELK